MTKVSNVLLARHLRLPANASEAKIRAALVTADERDKAITAAIAEGRILASRRADFEARWSNDPDGTRTLLTASAKAGGLAAMGRPLHATGSQRRLAASADSPVVRAAVRSSTDAELRAAVLAGTLDPALIAEEASHREFMAARLPAEARKAGYEPHKPDLAARGGITGTSVGISG